MIKISNGIGGPGVADFTWQSEMGTTFQLIWQHKGPWLFGAKGQDGKWMHQPTHALASVKTSKQAAVIAHEFVNKGEE